MRLTESQITDGLMHENVIVRDFVAEYFRSSFRTQSDITQYVIQAVEHYGWADVFRWTHRATAFELSAEQVPWALEHIDQAKLQGDENRSSHLCSMIVESPGDALMPHLDSLVAHPAMNLPAFRNAPISADRVKERIEVWGLDAEACWAQLREHCTALSNVESFEAANIPRCELLIDRIAAADVPTFDDEICAILRDTEVSFDDPTGWLVGCMIMLAGRRKLTAAIPYIFRQFEVDWDWYNEEIQFALVRIGSDDVLRYVAERYLDQPWYVRNFANDVFENIHSNSVFDFLLPLIEREEASDLCVQLGIAAASHFDTRGINAASEVFQRYEFDSESHLIPERLAAVTRLLDLDMPEADQWDQIARRDWEEFQERSKAIDEDFGSLFMSEPPAEEPDEELSGATIYRDTEKVGRNDPCPCGSGKKFKKCCIKLYS